MKPGEEYERIFDMPREQQIERIKLIANGLQLFLHTNPNDSSVLDDALRDLGYTIHVTREAIFHADQVRNLAKRPPSRAPRETTLEDLI